MSDQYQLRAIVNRTGHKAASIAKRFGAAMGEALLRVGGATSPVR